MRAIRPKTDNLPVDEPIERLLTQQPVAIYYRQSTQAQVGNISTAIQTVDMVAELERRGWSRDLIILIDDDEGVSGTKRIDERAGMTHLFELISDRKIGAVACQDEDRLFRDWTQIQVNIFIDACRKSQVQVITPSFSYDFSHPLYGDFHARQFRFKCDMAAEYIKSYILGRLTPAKQRLVNEGKWAGTKIPVGYMVDMRKNLPDGAANPNWRKLVPFEPYAEIVREHFRVFLEYGGVLRKAMRVIRQERISFPDSTPPDGFRANYKLKWREHGYYINRGSFIFLLTNPVYMGHWCSQGAVVQWNNHTPIVEADVFMQAFNYLSKLSLTGEANPDYQPSHQYDFSKAHDHKIEYPLCAGLIHTQVGDKWFRAGAKYDKKRKCYLYVMNSWDVYGVNVEWARSVAWIDGAIVGRFREKLTATFQMETWQNTLADSGQLREREKKVKRLQLASLKEDMENVIISLTTLTHPHLVQKLEKRYVEMEREEERLTREIETINQDQYRNVSLERAYKLFEQALLAWNTMTPDEQCRALAIGIDRIEVSDYTRSGDMRVVIKWRDGNSDEIQLWHKGKLFQFSVENVQHLLSLVDNGASQLEIAEAFADLKWYQIWNEIKKHRGVILFSPVYLGKNDIYQDYLRKGEPKGKSTSLAWTAEEVEQLKTLMENGAGQLEIMAAFPVRRWRYIREKIKNVCGKPVTYPPSEVSQWLTYIEHVQQSKTDNDDVSSEILALYS